MYFTVQTSLGSIQTAEKSVQGSGMGAKKKALVIAQLEAANVRVTAWLSTAIDEIVAELNEKKAWFTENAKDTLSETAGASDSSGTVSA